MPLALDETQEALRDAIGTLVASRYDWDKRRCIVASDASWSEDFWHELAHFGALSIPFPAEVGGLDGGAIEHFAVLEAFGEALVVEPYLSTVVIGGGLLIEADRPLARHLAQEVIAGSARLAWAQGERGARYALDDVTTTAVQNGDGWVIDGEKTVVVDAPVATHLLVVARTSGNRRDRAGIALFVVEGDHPGIERHDYATIDGRQASDVRFDRLHLTSEALLFDGPEAWSLLERAADGAAAAACAEMAGVMRGALRGTLAHTTQRQQFGQPLAQFQVLQHRMADMFMAYQLAHASALAAAQAMTAPPEQRARTVSAAKAFIGRVAQRVCEDAVQMHGGMGMTDELPIGHYLKRAVALDALFGSSAFHTYRFSELRRHG